MGAPFRDRNNATSGKSSRSRTLKLSLAPFCQYLPGATSVRLATCEALSPKGHRLLADCILLGRRGHRGLLRFTQNLDHLLVGESALSHPILFSDE